jgi:uracil-DNA glycosylase
MTLVIGQYAQAWHLDMKKKLSVTEVVRRWKKDFPRVIPLPHPSPRNNIWLKKNPWFETELLPALKAEIRKVLAKP